MHIHKPKAAHSLREFLSEIGVIVVGIAIALVGRRGFARNRMTVFGIDPEDRISRGIGGGFRVRWLLP